MSPKDAFLMFLEQPAELVCLLEHEDVWYAVWTKPEPVFADRPFNVHVFKTFARVPVFDFARSREIDVADEVHLMRSGEYDLNMTESLQLVADLMGGISL